MADSASESYPQSDTLGLRQISSSLFSIPGFFVGFSSKGSSESDSVRSPTSTLDFSFFANLSNPFSHRSPKSSFQNGRQKKWDCSKVGLGIVNSLAEETKPMGEVVESPKRKNIIFGPQVKINVLDSTRVNHESLSSSVKSNSLPRNYIISPLSQDKIANALFDSMDPLVSSWSSSSPIGSTSSLNLSSKKFCSASRTTMMTSPVVIGSSGLQIDNSLDVKPISLPIPIGSSHEFAGSLSAREIELSEDYTCIISHGPNPKTTHIFGDCVLECHTSELSNFDRKDELPQVAKRPEGSTLYPSDEFLSFCYSCNKRLQKGDDIYMYRVEKAFCSFDCRSREISIEEETEKTYNNSSKGSPDSSYHEDLFLMGMPIVR